MSKSAGGDNVPAVPSQKEWRKHLASVARLRSKLNADDADGSPFDPANLAIGGAARVVDEVSVTVPATVPVIGGMHFPAGAAGLALAYSVGKSAMSKRVRKAVKAVIRFQTQKLGYDGVDYARRQLLGGEAK